MQQVSPLTFGQAVWLWRRARGLTQAQLARRAGLPRPNLCAIERGRREVTLGTVRAMALALRVRPGALVDGLSPSTVDGPPPPLSRRDLERIAEAVVTGTRPRIPAYRALVTTLRQMVRQRVEASRGIRGRRPRGGTKAWQAAWLELRARYPRAMIASLLERIAEHQARHDQRGR